MFYKLNYSEWLYIVGCGNIVPILYRIASEWLDKSENYSFTF